MSLTHGLDPARVREVAAAFRRIAESATEVQDGVTATVHQLAQVWVGPDLEHFDRSWQVYARQQHAEVRAPVVTVEGGQAGG
ncbi:hypothetical protein [Janibacter massiliensis]|uniref:hypothetical protein n=1 Tax=Janibacter massiliensis TaxID=2058291 RepID=UPI000D0F92CB|nr:hypothetical protein [Janibacter massiliensis]